MYKTLIVVDSDMAWEDALLPEIISFETYLRDYPKRNERKTRIINLCDTEHYLSRGYYCSLLAEARRHTVVPSVKTINELRDEGREENGFWLEDEDIKGLEAVPVDQEHFVFFGRTVEPGLEKLAKKLFQKFAAPVLKLRLTEESGRIRLHIERSSYAALSESQQSEFRFFLLDFVKTVWRVSENKKKYRWDMAILVNPGEKVPPSNQEAISRFIKSASKHGIFAEAVTAEQLKNIANYDAVFIRETTAIDHHTYRLARAAEKHGLVVMDDATSILRCCNKIYLQDAFSYKGVPSPKTEVVSEISDTSLDRLEQEFEYPIVLKMPEGSFSLGVYKAANRAELKERLAELFQHTALVLAQEYLYTKYDWRIGVLNGRAIYACRYHMARGHWQIYNHGVTRFFSGGFETLPTFEVPKTVLDAALKAASVVGSGLYGVDIKLCDNRVYVLEVNDNPSIEHGVEDAYLGDELYMQIMSEFLRRLEQRGR